MATQVHPMQSGFEASKPMLRMIADNWQNDYNEKNVRYENLIGMFKKNKSNIEICVAGGTYEKKRNSLNENPNWIDFHCTSTNCAATLRIHNVQLAQEFSQADSSKTQFQCSAELIITHDCDLVQYQMRILKYLDLLRERAHDDEAKLNTYTGFFLQTRYADHMVNPPTVVFDHYLYLKSTEYNSGNRNMINLVCHGCGITASIVRRRVTTCTLASVHGKNSVKINQQTFKFELRDEIPPFSKECKNPLYMLRSKNVLGNGLRYVIPSLIQFVTALRIDKGFAEFGFITQADIEAELQAHELDVEELIGNENREQNVIEQEMMAHSVDEAELLEYDHADDTQEILSLND